MYRARGICPCLKTSYPDLCCGSFGMNQLAHKGITRGEVASFVGALPFKAALSSAGLTRYDERDIARCEDMACGVVYERRKVEKVEFLADWSKEEAMVPRLCGDCFG